jgi:hypothetical protein
MADGLMQDCETPTTLFPSLPGLTPQVGFTRLAALNIVELGQARVPMQSIILRKKMDARVKPAHDHRE